MSQKKKKIILFSYFIFIFAVCLLSILNGELLRIAADERVDELQLSLSRLESTADHLSALVVADQEKEEVEVGSFKKFILREHGGKVAIFSPSGELLRELDIFVRTLPERDRELLREGIEIDSIDDLYSLIQDLDG